MELISDTVTGDKNLRLDKSWALKKNLILDSDK